MRDFIQALPKVELHRTYISPVKNLSQANTLFGPFRVLAIPG
jgi:hypothetical protein